MLKNENENRILKTAFCNTLYKKLLYLAKLKLVAFLQTSEFPLEIPRSQNRNF